MNPQSGIFEPDNPHQHHLEWALRPGVTPEALAAAAVEARRADEVGDGSVAVVGFGPALVSALFSQVVPEDYAGFEPVGTDAGWYAPSTQADLWIWVQGRERAAVLDRAIAFAQALDGLARVVSDVPVFQRRENRDFTGFVDGTANPKEDARFAAALVSDGPAAGSSIALTQRWRHKLDAFNACPVAEQEGIIGRTKVDDIELEGDAMPNDSHVSRTDVKLDGEALKIYRRSAPYGDAREQGLLFLAFSCERRRIQVQLERMFGVWEDGLHDRIVEFSDALSGSYWFVPAEETLEAAKR